MAVNAALDALDVPYLIGGPIASASHGVMRATMDAHTIADLGQTDFTPLVLALGDTFYDDARRMHSAVQEHGAFDVDRLETIFKVDVFRAGAPVRSLPIGPPKAPCPGQRPWMERLRRRYRGHHPGKARVVSHGRRSF